MKEYSSENGKSRNRICWIVSAVHFALTFGFERLVLYFDLGRALEVALQIPLSDRFSISFQRGMVYGISKVMALVLILAFWKAVFYLFGEKVSKGSRILLCLVWGILIFLTVMGWPENFLSGYDNTITYGYALRLVPEYWHSILLTCLYTASFMVLPHGVSIVLIQCTLFMGAVGYLYLRLERSPVLGQVKSLKYFAFCLLFFRDTYNVFNNPERAEYNVSLLLIFVVTLVLDLLEGEQPDRRKISGFVAFGAFLSVFRSEGIVIAAIGTLAYVFAAGKRWKDRACYMALYFALVVALTLPGKVGEAGYYGRDYSIINTFPILQNILNAEDGDLSYEGATEDLAAIEAIVPADLVAEYGTMGYRRYNYSLGHVDFNQSAADPEVSEAYLAAYRRLVLKNIPIFLRTQFSMVFSALGLGNEVYQAPYTGAHTEIADVGRELWDVGTKDMLEVPGRYKWEHFGLRIAVFQAAVIAKLAYMDFLTDTGIYFALNLAEIAAGLAIMVLSFVKVLKKRRTYLPLFLASFALSAYVALLALAIPVEANMYFHAYIYSMFALILMFAGLVIIEKKEKK